MGEQSKSKVHAPYNFVSFSEKVLLRYAGPEELPRHDRMDPALKSGEIHVTMTADTPVFVSDGRDNFFRAPNGQYALPGSTIRGMVRQNMQILGFGCVHPGEDFEDVQIYFREMAAARGSAGGALKAYYQAALGVETRKVDRGRSVSVPTKVRAGYLRSTGRGYVIQPVRGTYLRVSRKHPDAAALGLDPAQAVPVAYRAAGDRVTALRRGGDPVPGMERGMLLVTGRPVGRPNHLYLFPQADEDKPAVELSDQDVLSYQEDWENRKNVLGRANFWALPRAGEEKPVFYLRHEGHTYFGMSLFLRIGYGSALSQGLPQRHRDAQAEPGVDYPHGILGFAGPEGAYRSRVSFGDLPALGQVKPEPPLGAVLAGPKPSYYPGYVAEGKNYAQEGFRLRGYKQYWLKEPGKVPAGKEKVQSTLRPLPKGTRFRGVIRFQNLHEDELGLLLWCLRLDEGCYQSLGMGKPLGLGRMELHIDRLVETDPTELYSPENLCGPAGADRTDRVEDYIRAYDRYAADRLRLKQPSIRSRAEIKDFFYLRRQIQPGERAGYMALEEYKNVRQPLPTVADFRADEGELAKPPEEKTAPTMEELMAQLAQKYGRH